MYAKTKTEIEQIARKYGGSLLSTEHAYTQAFNEKYKVVRAQWAIDPTDSEMQRIREVGKKDNFIKEARAGGWTGKTSKFMGMRNTLIYMLEIKYKRGA